MPTHAFIDDNGDMHCVFPSGYPADKLHPLPEDYFSRGWYKWHNNAFIDDLATWKKCALINIKKDKEYALYEEGCEIPGIGTIDIDLKSRQLLYNIALEASMNEEPNYSIDITMKDDQIVTCTKEDVTSIITHLREHDQTAHDIYTSKKSQINNTSTILFELL